MLRISYIEVKVNLRRDDEDGDSEYVGQIEGMGYHHRDQEENIVVYMTMEKNMTINTDELFQVTNISANVEELLKDVTPDELTAINEAYRCM